MVAASPLTRSRALKEERVEQRVVAIGDSLVYGYGDPEGGGWVERLRRRWLQPETPGHAIYNLGVRGDTVQRVSLRLVQEFQTRGEFRNRVPDRLFLSVGMNDAARVGKPTGRHLTDFDTFQEEMLELLDAASALCPVAFIGMTPVLEERMPFAEVLHYRHLDQYRYKEATRQLCRQKNIPYLDIFDLWLSRGDAWWRSRISTDGLHPNVLGYRSLLEEVTCWQTFQDWL
ncbi:GDSL-type esterase/lipase family protein [Oscillatoria sp. CS-180]|uniref:GDSL-type esterase/lipase family protein n=1 Tax=Oscillatoria sp. CS-180 TaxID=3021720 RepID=UPI00232F738B|nr:GDSL-type esterase/lipase family protein [Oscillatoria sp. CS-180]MDB9527446.1 GDSL-type esterase/lipase family protein [Oscillatoria sp. CS-180]